jgi:hypothetical protein
MLISCIDMPATVNASDDSDECGQSAYIISQAECKLSRGERYATGFYKANMALSSQTYKIAGLCGWLTSSAWSGVYGTPSIGCC